MWKIILSQRTKYYHKISKRTKPPGCSRRTRMVFNTLTPEQRLINHKWSGFLKEPPPDCAYKTKVKNDGYYTDLAICEFHCERQCPIYFAVRKLFKKGR
jgi:hypothetical protein